MHERTQPVIRPCRDDETDAMLAVINAAAQAYRGVIPADRWHEPYMAASELRSELASGVAFVACEVEGAIGGVMGIQPVRNVDLIRHAYVLPEHQGRGLGRALLAHLRARTERPILIGTWAAATWAVAFYERHAFHLVPDAAKALLLRTYWNIEERQIETSVVLSAPRLTVPQADELVDRARRAMADGGRS
jgi:GNAT superfamily N-acetyltransferase